MHPKLRAIIKNWWLFYGIFVIIIYFFDILAGIGLTFLGIGIGLVIYFVQRRSKVSLSKNLLGMSRIDEHELAKLAGVYSEEAHSFLHDVSRNPDASGIPILVKGVYIYFSNKIVRQFKDLYAEGLNTKGILKEIPEFQTREEVKKMLEKLREFDELPEREKKKRY